MTHEGSGVMVGIHQGIGTEVGKEETGEGFDWQVKQKERVGTGEYKTEGYRVRLPLEAVC